MKDQNRIIDFFYSILWTKDIRNNKKKILKRTVKRLPRFRAVGGGNRKEALGDNDNIYS